MNRPLTYLLVSCTLIFIAAVAPVTVAAQSRAQPTLPAVKLNAGIHVITAEAATTEQTRVMGLMFRERLAPNHGMLFVFDYRSQQCFWMRNTPLPLTIAFIEDDGTVVQLVDMAPQTDTLHCSKKPVRFALEMEQGWFAKRGIAPGSKLGGLPGNR
jgi:uncharacterized membrane protein (UPF0127 family)